MLRHTNNNATVQISWPYDPSNLVNHELNFGRQLALTPRAHIPIKIENMVSIRVAVRLLMTCRDQTILLDIYYLIYKINHDRCGQPAWYAYSFLTPGTTTKTSLGSRWSLFYCVNSGFRLVDPAAFCCSVWHGISLLL